MIMEKIAAVMLRGYKFTFGQKIPTTNSGVITVILMKQDSDGLILSATGDLTLQIFTNENMLDNELGKMIRQISDYQIHRHNANIDSCLHEPVANTINGEVLVLCRKCMAKGELANETHEEIPFRFPNAVEDGTKAKKHEQLIKLNLQ